MNTRQAESALTSLQAFLHTSLETRLAHPDRPDPQIKAVRLFHTVAESVPAYRAFLEENGVRADGVRTFADFQQVPPVTKDNYLLRHRLPSLCRNGALEACDMIAVSSGSTGSPCFWPRFLSDELNIAFRFEQIFRDSFRADERRTLALVCFTLGTWVGGMYTAACCRHLAAKGYPVTVVTPGNNREEIFRVVEELGPLYDQTVLLGYPPFLKGIVDEGRARGVDWSRYRIKWVMAGEVFSEEWRTLVAERVGSDSPGMDSATLYGTADAGVLGNESPLSICIRRWLASNPAAARQLFGESRLPTLVQYDPLSRFFEEVNGELLFSGDNGIPLVRYNILDTGGILPYGTMLEFLREWKFDPLAQIEQGTRGIYPLPFVYVFGRSNFTVSYFGANIYPENVTVGLEQPGIKEWVTGKFVLQAVEDDDRNRHLSVIVELAPGCHEDDEGKRLIAHSIQEHLCRLNSEFANYVPPDSQAPVISLRPSGDPEYFPIGVKHRYTRQ